MCSTLEQRPRPILLRQRNCARSVDSSIMYNWAKHFVNEAKQLREGVRKLLMILDGYGTYIQYSSLDLLEENDVTVVALPSYISHLLKTLEISVFSLFQILLRT